MPKEKMTLAQTELMFGRGKPGLDDSKAEQRDAKINIFTMSDALESVRLAISKSPYNWRLVPDPDGWNCGHSLYRKKTTSIPGLQDGYVTWRKIDRSEDFKTDYIHFKDDLDKCVRELIKEIMDDPGISDDDLNHQYKTYIKLLTTFKDKVGQSGGQNLVTMAAAGMWGMHKPSRSVSGHKEAFQAVPPLTAFSESLRSLTYGDLLTIYGEPAMELLMIALGRTLVGGDGTKMHEGSVVKSNTRIVVLQTGGSGLGKSTFTNELTRMMRLCGYDFGTVDPNAGKFGWGRIVTHGGVLDDIDKNVHKIINLPIVKMISGLAEDIWCEDKGTPGQPRKAKGIMWINANEMDARVHESDSGVLERVALITLLSIEEMREKYGVDWEEYTLFKRWANISEQYKVSPQAIMLYIMRLAIDKYLSLSGHIYADEKKTFFNYHRKEDRLEKTIKELKAKLPAKLGSYHIQELVDKVGNLVALAVASVSNQREFETYLGYTKKSGFEINILRKYIEIITSEKLLENTGHLFDPRALDNESLKHLTAKYKNGDFQESTWGKKDLSAKYSELLAGIYAQGQTYWPGKGIWAKQEYEKHWQNIRTSLVERILTFRAEFASIEDSILSTKDGQENIEYHREIWGDVRKQLINKRV